MNRSTLVRELEQLSLGQNEALVYLELLSLGATNAGPLVRETGLHRQLVYAALDRLEDSGLVSVSVYNNRKVFQAAPPDNLIALQEERERRARTLLPHLLALEPKNQDRLSVQTLSGTNELFRSIITAIEIASKHEGVIRVIGGASSESFYAALGERYEEYVERCKEMKIKKHLITPAGTSEIFKRRFAQEKGTVLKLVDEGLSSPTYTRITPELVSLEIYSAEPTVIQIWNQEIAKGYIEHFELLWKKAKRFVPS